MDFKSTLHLPDAEATIPMKANLPSLEPSIQKIWDEQAIYHKIQKSRATAPVYVYHDGPPYTNSPIHLGTAMNKILKDFAVKSRTMMGYRVPYVPGFDNHGLPIEQAVIKKLVDDVIAFMGFNQRLTQSGISNPAMHSLFDNWLSKASSPEPDVQRLFAGQRKRSHETSLLFLTFRLLRAKQEREDMIRNLVKDLMSGPIRPERLGDADSKFIESFSNKPFSYQDFVVDVSRRILRKSKGDSPDHRAIQDEIRSRVELRQACRDHAAHYLKIQTEQFKRLGVFAMWELPYTTMEFAFEAEIVRVFKRLAEGGYVYKGLRPTLWSPTSRTALADTEIVYNDHVSKAIYVRFPLLKDPNRLFEGMSNVFTVIWTTTPWTIPSNFACAFHPDFTYDLVKVGQNHYLLLRELVEKVAAANGWAEYEVVKSLEGINFENMVFKHPIFDRPSIAVMAHYVTTEDGTGVVHTAPSHGRDDFFTGLKYNLPVPNTVDERGILTHEAGEFEGTFYKKCDTVVVDRLNELGMLLSVSDYSHSYPYAERDGQPIIFRATEQWFVSLEHLDLRTRMLESIQTVAWHPPQGQTRIEAMVRNRPDWCISRQRPWGVGIPVFYGARSRVPVLDSVAIEAVAQLIEREGSDAWFMKEASEILPAGYTHPETGETEFTKETDVLDVWFDSGSTSMCVLEGNVHQEWKESLPADLYLEGSDQHRGWFNSSLVLSQAILDQAPYKAVVTHGFVTDGDGLKMSKRLGNVIEPVKACDEVGADVLRYWVAGTDYTNDVPCSDAILKQFGESYRNIRNAIRFLVGNLKGYNPSMAPEQLLELDEWIIEQSELLTDECVSSYEAFDFGSVMTAVHNFCRQQLSAFYSDAIKDRMYCDLEGSEARRSGQHACHVVASALIRLVSPVLAHTAEEAWTKMHETMGVECSSVHIDLFGRPDSSRLQDIEASDIQVRFASLISTRQTINGAFEAYKGTDGIKNSQEVVVFLSIDQDLYDTLTTFSRADLANFFKVSWVELFVGDDGIRFERSPYDECVRSRVRRPDVEKVTVDGEEVFLSRRDREALGL